VLERYAEADVEALLDAFGVVRRNPFYERRLP
jgi:hypothetical protein